MKRARGAAMPALFLLLLTVLASCGGADEGMQGSEHGDGSKQAEEPASGKDDDVRARQMLSGENGRYSDARFVDAMVPHHEGAVEMAEVALENAEHEEIQTLSEDIISAQKAEIETLHGIRAGLDAGPRMSMGEEDMQMMDMTDPEDLAKRKPFDRAFIDAMIPHHESAVSMAEVALSESEDRSVRVLAGDIIDAQQREIEQMEGWRGRWYPEG